MNKSIPILTPLRGIAALCVVFFHARLVIFSQWKDPVGEYTQFIENSYLWVDLFFILSGFVMMHIYQQTFSKGITFSSWRQFMWLRFSRIYPLFLVTLLVLVLWETIKSSAGIGFYGGALFESWGVSGIPAFAGPFNRAEALLPNALMLQGVLEKDLSWNISSWSLSVEWLSYMVFPFLVPALAARRRMTLWVPVVFLLLLMGINAHHGSLDVTGGFLAYLRAIASFALGSWMCTIIVSQARKKLLNNDGLLLLVFSASLWMLHLPKSPSHNVITVTVFALLVFVAAQQTERKTPVFKLLDNRVTRFLGDISYSLYLWHAVLMLAGIEIIHLAMPELLAWWNTQTEWWVGLTGAAVFIAVTIGVSTLSYYYLERPAMKLLRNKFKRQQVSASVVS